MYILYSEAIRQLCLRKRLKIVVFIYFLCVEMRRQSGKLLLLCLTEERRAYKELKMHILKMGWGGYFYIKIKKTQQEVKRPCANPLALFTDYATCA